MPSFANYTQIAIVNKSTIISDEDGSNMVLALNLLLPKFCSNWGISLFTAVYVAKGVENLPAISYNINLLDDTDSPGTFAYHDISSDVPFANVFAKTVLSENGVILYEPTHKKPTVAQALSHEAFELIIDPRCNLWWMNYYTGQMVPGEVCDPVERNVVVVTLANDVKIGMSDWVLPSWTDAQNTTGPFNHLNTLRKPYEVKNGYLISSESINSVTNSQYHLNRPYNSRAVAIKAPLNKC